MAKQNVLGLPRQKKKKNVLDLDGPTVGVGLRLTKVEVGYYQHFNRIKFEIFFVTREICCTPLFRTEFRRIWRK